MAKTIIPVIHCFDTRYVPAAAVAFLSMLEHASSDYYYKLFVMHSDITPEQQMRLQQVICRFSNASLEFIEMHDKWFGMFDQIKNKAHYAKEMLYKLLIPEFFTAFDKAIVTDVDVLYRGDISRSFVDFDVQEMDREYYCAGISYKDLDLGYKKGSSYKNFQSKYKLYTNEERKSLAEGVGAGYLILNLRQMRLHNLSASFCRCLERKARSLVQAEQDVINICCYPHIKYLDPREMVCTYLWEWTTEEERQCLHSILENPIQVHFATGIKPWNNSNCLFIEEWFSYLIRTPFLKDVLLSDAYMAEVLNKKKKRAGLLRYKFKNGMLRFKLFGVIPFVKVRIFS